MTVDVFVTHTAADPDPHLHNYTNAYYRKAQAEELMTTYVNGSKADVVLLGGDFNAGPVNKEGTNWQSSCIMPCSKHCNFRFP